jgi:hypothetical protein
MGTEAKGAGLNWIRFTTNGTGTPTDIVDIGGILDVDEPVVRAQQSIFSVKLKDRFVRVFAQPRIAEVPGQPGGVPERVQTTAIVEGTNQINGFGIRVQNADGSTSADTTGYVIEVQIGLTSWLGRGET